MSLHDRLSFVIASSICPEHPNTSMIETTITSTWRMLGEQITPIIMCDWPSVFYDEMDLQRYRRYLAELMELGIGNVVMQPEFSGQVGAWERMKKFDLKPVVYFSHDDWEVIGDIDSQPLVGLMCRRPHISMVKLHKRPIAQHVPGQHKYVDDYEAKVPIEVDGVPLVKTSGWGTSPHFARVDHYREKVWPRLQPNSDPHGRRGIENVVYEAYRDDQIKNGFEQAHSRWGVYLYGRMGDGPFIRHLGRKRMIRRRQDDKKHMVNAGSGFRFGR